MKLTEQCGDRAIEATWMERKVVYGADIIFTISENNQFRGLDVLANLQTLVNKLDNTLRKAKQPMMDNNYGLAAFGGINIHAGAHSHTIHGQLMNEARWMPKGLASLEFNGSYPTDAFEAIRLASQYKFRPGAAKAIVLIVESERKVRTRSEQG